MKQSILITLLLAIFGYGVFAQSPTAPALGFNVFVEKGAKLTTNETEGPLACGEDLTVAGNYQVSTNYSGTFLVNGLKTTLVVGGKINYLGGNSLQVNQNGYVKIGDSTGSYVWYKDQNNAYAPIRITPGPNYNGSPRISLQANALQLGLVSAINKPVFQKNLIDFTSAFTLMRATSSSMSTCTDNAIIKNPNGGVIAHTGLPSQIKITLNLGVNVLNITGADLNAVSNIIFTNNPDVLHTLIINVNAAGSFNWNVWNQAGIGLAHSPYILYNFYNTTALNIQGNSTIEGTLYAPFADVVKTVNQSNIEGQVICRSFDHSGGENHYAVFSPAVGGCLPAASFLVNNLVQCHKGNSFSFSGFSAGSGVLSYLWDFGDSTTSTLQNPVKSFTQPGSYTVALTVSSSLGSATVFQTVTVQASPEAGFSINDSVQALTGNSFSFTSINLHGNKCFWTFTDNTSSYLLDPVRTFAAAGRYRVVQLVTNTAGCKDSLVKYVIVESDSVSSGTGGGLESESLGGLVNKRDFNRVKNSFDPRVNYETMPVYKHTRVMTKTGDLQMADIFPQELEAGDVLRVSSPTDLLTLTRAVEVLAVDFTRENRAKAVVLGLKTLNKSYNHTKSICDRLRGAKLLSVENVNIKGYDFTRFALQQEDGVVEYAIAFVIGSVSGRDHYTIQTNWVISTYVNEDVMFNFQVWATQPAYTDKLVADMIDNITAAKPLIQGNVNMIPKAFITNGMREKGNLVVNITNNTEFGSGKLYIEERKNEQSSYSVIDMPLTLVSGDQNKIEIPVKDGYEYSALLYVNDELIDEAYMADGNWGLDYETTSMSVSEFVTSNDPARVYANNEFPVYRSVSLKATGTDYITLYKSVKPGTTRADLTAYEALRFYAKGKGKALIRLSKESIINWADQYTATVDLDENGKEYIIRFSDLRSNTFSTPFVANDVKILSFTFVAENGATQDVDFAVSDVRFGSAASTTGVKESTANRISVYPNPNNGEFSFSFISEKSGSYDLVLTDMIGRVVYSKTVTIMKGSNSINIDLRGELSHTGIFFATFQGLPYTAKKIIIE